MKFMWLGWLLIQHLVGLTTHCSIPSCFVPMSNWQHYCFMNSRTGLFMLEVTLDSMKVWRQRLSCMRWNNGCRLETNRVGLIDTG